MMEDSTPHHVYNTPWALPCTVLSRSWSILRAFIEAGSDLGSVSHDSTLTTDPGSLTRSDEGPRHVQSVLHPQPRRPSEDRPSLRSILSLTSESNSCRPSTCDSDDCERCTSLTHSREKAQCLTLPSSANWSAFSFPMMSICEGTHCIENRSPS